MYFLGFVEKKLKILFRSRYNDIYPVYYDKMDRKRRKESLLKSHSCVGTRIKNFILFQFTLRIPKSKYYDNCTN